MKNFNNSIKIKLLALTLVLSGCIESAKVNVNEDGTVQIETDELPPNVPGNLRAESVTQNSLLLVWDASADNGDAGIKHYRVYLDNRLVGATTATSFSMTSLRADTAYNLGVNAVDKHGNASAVATISRRTSGSGVPINLAPSAPTSLNISNVTQNSFDLSFAASTDPEDGAVRGYKVMLNEVIGAEFNALQKSISGLSPNTEYRVRVLSVDSHGLVSPASAELRRTTLPSIVNPAHQTINIEAESASLTSGWVKESSSPGYSGTGYVRWAGTDRSGIQFDDVAAAEANGTIKKLTYDFNISTPGTYKVVARVRRDTTDPEPDPDGSNDVFLKVVGKVALQKYFPPFPFPWNNWITSGRYTYTESRKEVLSVDFSTAGNYQVQLGGRSPGFMVDKIVVTNDFQAAPPPVNLRILSRENGFVRIGWDPVIDSDGNPISHYNYYLDETSDAPNGAVFTNEVILKDILPTDARPFSVRTYDHAYNRGAASVKIHLNDPIDGGGGSSSSSSSEIPDDDDGGGGDDNGAPEVVESFGPNGTHWPKLLPTPFMYDSTVPNVVDVAASWTAIKEALVNAKNNPAKVSAGLLIRVAPGTITSSVSADSKGFKKVLFELGDINWTKRVTVMPRDGFGSVSIADKVQLEKIHGVNFAGFNFTKSVRFWDNSKSALSWSLFQDNLILYSSRSSEEAHTIELVEVVFPNSSTNETDTANIYDIGGKVRNVHLTGSYIAPRFKPTTSSTAHVDTFQYGASCDGSKCVERYRDMVITDTTIYGSSNAALQIGRINGLLIDHSMILNKEASFEVFPKLGTGDGSFSSLNGSGKNLRARNSIFYGFMNLNNSLVPDTEKPWISVENTLVTSLRSQISGSTDNTNRPVTGSFTVDSNLIDKIVHPPKPTNSVNDPFLKCIWVHRRGSACNNL